MKNMIFGGLAALSLSALLMTSCTGESVESNRDNSRLLTYKTAVGRPSATRAAETNPSNINGKTLKVWVYFNSGASANTRFNTYDLTYNSTKSEWEYGSAAAFHPEAGLTHYSIHPATNVETTVSDDLNAIDAAASNASFEYTATHDEDLIAAVDTTTGDTQVNATAKLVYKHLLSQINFAVSGPQGVKVAIDGIKLSGIATKAGYSFVSGWGTPSTPGTYSYTIDGSGTTTGALADEVVYFGNHTAPNADGNGAQDYSHNNALMLLPQSFTPSGGASFSFNYTMKDATSDVVLKSGNNVSVDLGNLNPTKWEAGKRYLYTINFADLNVIKYTVNVDSWVDDNGTDGKIDTPEL